MGLEGIKPGDKLYCHTRFRDQIIIATVKRVTKTLAITEGDARIRLANGHQHGTSSWDSIHWRKAEPEHIEEHAIQSRLHKVEKIKWHEIRDDAIVKVLAALSNFKDGGKKEE
jgi:hypothetical protein